MNKAQAIKFLKNFDFTNLFIEELGWDRHAAPIEVTIAEHTFQLRSVAHKRGFVAYLCELDVLPDYATRRKIEQQVVKVTREHIIIFTDKFKKAQIWQWVKRTPGKPIACREHQFRVDQTGEALIQKLQVIAFSFDEEDELTLTDVTTRTSSGFDVERVTKRFFDRFKKEHSAFLEFISGIKEKADHEWYTSVMLNRLMFIYFIQRKGFLDGNPNYLREKLATTKEEHGEDKFYSFYRYFLLKLFHEGLGKKSRSKELDAMLGKIPYLNGGLFDIHAIEQSYPDIQIPDTAFERIFDYFDQYQWHLDERPLRADNEINPDVLGYIFEKYINQKQMGAYYTKEDITEYISKNTVLPFLFDAAKPHCTIAFENPDGSTIWNLLSAAPESYIYPAVKHGVICSDGSILPETDLPDFVQAGMKDPNARMFENRYNLQQAPADNPIRLVTETWREYIYRRERCLDILGKLQRGEIRDINEFITYNLDIRQFAQDVIENSEGPELIRAFWTAIQKVTVLDPTCGSGAFLFAALNILEPLYEACLNRMESFIEDDAHKEGEKREKFTDFKEILQRVGTHPNRRYFIFKSIILNNLYGVDIMEEAVEICRLRLFLKLAAQVEPDRSKENFGIEPLPDIDFNIRAGNTLVGYVSLSEVRRSMASRLDLDDAMARFQSAAEGVDETYKHFRKLQTEERPDAGAVAKAKKELQKQLSELSKELDKNLSVEYKKKPKEFDEWKKTHMPFHWLVEFYGMMKQGGFDVIIGNPPYVGYPIKNDPYTVINFDTLSTKNLYSMIVERATQIVEKQGNIGVILPISSVSTVSMTPLLKMYENKNMNCAISSFAGDSHPGQLFNGVKIQLSIHLLSRNIKTHITTNNYRWYEIFRPFLFQTIQYQPVTRLIWKEGKYEFFLKLGNGFDVSIVDKIFIQRRSISSFFIKSGHLKFYYRNASGAMYRMAFINPPYVEINNKQQLSTTTEEQPVSHCPECFVSLLNSSLFNLFWIIASDNYHITSKDLAIMRCDVDEIGASQSANLRKITKKLMVSYIDNSEMRTEQNFRNNTTRIVRYFDPRQSKSIIDQIDVILAQHYGFSDFELDYIINYDIRYRMGNETENEEE